MHRRLPTLVAAFVLAVPSAALAQSGQGLAPPGNSGIEEYTEAVPTGSGNRPTNGIVARPHKPLSGPTARALAAQGRYGKQVAAIVAATAPPAAQRVADHRGLQPSNTRPQ